MELLSRLTLISLVLATSLRTQPRKLPADRAAYAAASSLEDPGARIAAFEKFLRDFPGAPQAYSAHYAIFETTVEFHRTDRDQVMAQAKRQLRAVPRNDYGRLATAIAAHLHDEKLFPKDAERFALIAVKAKGPAQRRADAEGTLGQIYRRAGDAEKAALWLRRALTTNAASAGSATALAEMAAEAGRQEEALALFAQAQLARPGREALAQVAKAWTQAGRAPAGLTAYLDQRHRQLFPSPLSVERYTPAAKPNQRLVLAEVHTGAGCRPCLAADLAIDAALERYSRQHLAVVMYHQHIPLPDPFTNESSMELFKERGGRGVPLLLVDGQPINAAGLREQAAQAAAELHSAIDRRLPVAPAAALRVEASREGAVLQVIAHTAHAPAEATLRIALVEKLVSYSGESGVRFHPMVARSTHKVTQPPARVEHSFHLPSVAQQVKKYLDRFEAHEEHYNPDGTFRFLERKDALDENNLAIVAYLETGKEVLQTAYLDLQAAPR